MVSHVPVVAILLIIQGVLECLAGILVGALGPVMFSVMSQVPPQPGVQPPPKEFVGVIGAIYLIIGVVVLSLGILRIVAGVRNLKYRGRVFGIVAMSAGVLTSFTCYCLPTSLGMLIYGLIVYLNNDVTRAFDMGEQGMTPEQIRQSFNNPLGTAPPGTAPGSPYRPPQM